VLAAQNGITISDYSVAPGAPSTVSFTVSWNKDKIDSAWVFVDYNDSGTMTRLPLSGATASAGSRAYMVSGNDQGAWVVADVSGAFSATVQLVAACRDARPCVPTGACVYAIDYPPVGKYTAAYRIEFTGTPPFYLQFGDDDSRDTLERTAQPPYTYTIPSGKTLASFTDASGASGYMEPPPPCVTSAECESGYCVCGVCMKENASCYNNEYAYVSQIVEAPCPKEWAITTDCPNVILVHWQTYWLDATTMQKFTYCRADGSSYTTTSGPRPGVTFGNYWFYHMCYLKIR
ncbi:MAG: hypothetical protein LBT49_01200, partial [Prevotellaceae bacterium]|jgi:hypothetical protein|nr:hypothetical protein [Prevotellaceae bacterium]